MGIFNTLANAGLASALFGGSFGSRLGQQAAVDVGSNLISGLIGGNAGHGILQDTAIKAGVASVAFGGSFLDRAKEQGVVSLISGLFGLGGQQQQRDFGGYQEFNQNQFGFNQVAPPSWHNSPFIPPGMAAYGYGGMNNGVGFNPRAQQLDFNPLDVLNQGRMLHNAGMGMDFQGGRPMNYNHNEVGAALNVIMQALSGGRGGGRGGFT